MKHPLLKLSLLILFTSIIFGTDVYGISTQNALTDSLRKELISRTGAEKIAIELELALEIFDTNNQEAKELANSALESSKNLGDLSLEMQSYYVHGRVFLTYEEIAVSQAYYDTALFISDIIRDLEYKGEILFRQGVNHYKSSDQVKALESYGNALSACRASENFKVMGSIYSMMGTIFRVNGMYDRAIEYNIKSSLNYGKAEFEEGEAWVNYLLGRIYADINKAEKALEYFNLSLGIYEHIASIDGNENGLAICHEQIALQELILGNHSKARSSIDIVLDIHTRGESKYGISSAYIIYGKIEYSAGNFLLAEDYLRKSLDLTKEVDHELGFSVIYEYLGLCLVAKGQVNKGVEMMKQGLHRAGIHKQGKIELDINKKLAEIFLNLNDPAQASMYQKEVIRIQNEILFEAASTKMEQLQALYEIDEKNMQILELEKENEISSLRIQQQHNLQTFMVIAILLSVIIALVIFLSYRKIQENNRQLKESNITKDKLFSIISHDLQGPMGTTRGLSEVLRQKLENKNESDFMEIFHSMHQNIHETYDLLTNLLQWARTQIKGIQFNPEILSMEEMTEKALKSVANQIQAKNIKITVDIDLGISVFADVNMLDAILRNLLSNAMKFTNEGGNIVVNAIQLNQQTQVCIQDDGIGMSTDTLNNLFSLDENTSTPGTSGEKGTGLGLIVCKEFIEIHKGKIWVISTPNEGSSFYFTIPGQDSI